MTRQLLPSRERNASAVACHFCGFLSSPNSARFSWDDPIFHLRDGPCLLAWAGTGAAKFRATHKVAELASCRPALPHPSHRVVCLSPFPISTQPTSPSDTLKCFTCLQLLRSRASHARRPVPTVRPKQSTRCMSACCCDGGVGVQEAAMCGDTGGTSSCRRCDSRTTHASKLPLSVLLFGTSANRLLPNLNTPSFCLLPFPAFLVLWGAATPTHFNALLSTT